MIHTKPGRQGERELKARYEEASAKAFELKAALLNEVLFSTVISSEEMLQGYSLIEAINPESLSTAEVLGALHLEWRRKLPSSGRLLSLLDSFFTICWRIETYKQLDQLPPKA
jgi:hypothetical protein